MIFLTPEAAFLLPLIAGFLMIQSGSVPSILPAEVEQMMQRDSVAFLLDVRTDPEFVGPLGHIPGATLIPVQELDRRLDELEPYRSRTIIVICRSGVRSARATMLLREHGFHALNMAGGMLRWNTEGRPLQSQETP